MKRSYLARKAELRARCASGRRRYKTAEAAQRVLDRIAATADPTRLKAPKRAYFCDKGCGGWHVSSQPTWLPRTPLRQRSAKTERVYRTLRRPLVVEILAERPWCKIRFDENCTGRATTLHELRKRSQGGSITDEANVVPACAHCNGAIEDNPAEAHMRGFVVRRGDVA